MIEYRSAYRGWVRARIVQQFPEKDLFILFDHYGGTYHRVTSKNIRPIAE